jgi:glycosyltransferase involved in cell wall biosynthesis
MRGPDHGKSTIDLPRLILALRRKDLCKRLGYDQPARLNAYRGWLLTAGRAEYKVLTEDPEFLQSLQQHDAALGVSTVAGLVWHARPDVRKAFPLPDKKMEFMHWFFCHGVGEHDLWPFLTPAEKSATVEVASLSASPWRSHLEALASGEAESGPALSARTKRSREKAGPRSSRRSARPFGVNLVGYSYGQLGIGEDLRMTAQALKVANVPFAVVDFPPGADVPQGDRSVARYVVEEGPYAINLFCMTALETGRFYAERGRQQFAGRYNIGYWPWELEQWPKDWSLVFGLVDEVWVSTSHIRDALLTARDPAFEKPLHVMPLVVEVPGAPQLRSASARRATRAHHGLPASARLFCFAFDLNSSIHRKNPQAVVQAFRRAFPASLYTAAEVGLVVKVQPPRRPHRAWESLKRLAAQDPRIHIVEQSLPRRELLGLFAACDCFVSLHRAEGFGRGLAEALQLGLHVITTDYSGNTDFCRRPEFAGQVSAVPWRWAAVRAGQYPYGEGQRWANPDVTAATTAMRRFVEQPPPPPKVPCGGWPCFSARELGEKYAARLRELSKNG